jgi:hypothetical protein
VVLKSLKETVKTGSVKEAHGQDHVHTDLVETLLLADDETPILNVGSLS